VSQIFSARHGLERTQEAVVEVRKDLYREIDRLLLINEALWSIVSERLGVGETELSARIHAIDLRDGRLDGRVDGARVVCASCGKMNLRFHQQCIFCAADLPT